MPSLMSTIEESIAVTVVPSLAVYDARTDTASLRFGTIVVFGCTSM